MSSDDLQLVLTVSTQFEGLLAKAFGATGTSLGKKINSVKGELPKPIVDALFEINRVRNIFAHEANMCLPPGERAKFIDLVNRCNASLVTHCTSSVYVRNRAAIHCWVDSCPVPLDDRTKNRIKSALLQLLDGPTSASAAPS